jgi:hypothetical protein
MLFFAKIIKCQFFRAFLYTLLINKVSDFGVLDFGVREFRSSDSTFDAPKTPRRGRKDIRLNS